jgi:hypothetical protein
LLYTITEELGLDANTGAVMGRGSCAQILTKRIRVALGE